MVVFVRVVNIIDFLKLYVIARSVRCDEAIPNFDGDCFGRKNTALAMTCEQNKNLPSTKWDERHLSISRYHPR